VFALVEVMKQDEEVEVFEEEALTGLKEE